MASASTTDRSTAGRPVTVARSVSENPDPRMEADRNASSVGSGRKLSRRKMVSRSVGGSTVSATSARPPAVVIAPSWASAPSSSVTNSGLPAAPET